MILYEKILNLYTIYWKNGDEIVKEKTKMSIENMQALYQTLADIFAEKYNASVKVRVKKKEG